MNGTNETLQRIGWALLRVVSGVLLATHGWAKIAGTPESPGFALGSFTEKVAALGIPMPEFFAWAAVAAELVGGLMIAVGLLTRPMAAVAAFTMAVAVWSHADDPFAQQEKALLFLVIFFVFLLGGSGPVSFDDWIRARRARASASIFR